MTVSLSAGVRAALNSLQSTTFLAQATQVRLATGKRVNTALDNPKSFFIAAGLTNRASDLSNLLDDIGQATKVLEAADKGLSSISKLIDQAKATLSSASASAGTTARVAGTVSSLTASQVIGGGFVAGNTITFNDGTTTATFTAAAGSTVQNVLDAVNNTALLQIKASLTSDGKIQLEATGTNTIVIAGTSTALEKATIGLVAGTTAAGTSNTTRSGAATTYNSLRTQIDQLAADSGYNGTNLLNNGSLKVTFNETNTSSLTIAGVKYDSAGLAVSAAANTFQTDFDIAAALTQLNAASSTLRAQASTFGSNLAVVNNRTDFITSLVRTLNSGADLLTLADSNEEGANLLALNTRQQLSQTALSLSAQQDQAVLRLFG